MLLSELQFASFLAYSTRGDDAVARESQAWMRKLKNDAVPVGSRVATSRLVAERLAKTIGSTELVEILGPTRVLIPVPRSSPPPRNQRHQLWVPERIARALVEVGLGKRVWPCLERWRAVPVSSRAKPDDRPKPAEHFESVRVRRDALEFDETEELILIDDIVTRGSTLLGCANRLAAAFPNARIRAFAAMRAVSNSDEFVAIRDPRVGLIKLRGRETQRRP